MRADGRRERLEPGARLALGDRLALEFKGTKDLHLYVIDEDDHGRAYALFPLPGLEIRNPLAAGRTHVLPGVQQGQDTFWKVDSTGGREHLLVLASLERLVEFEAEMSRLPRPAEGSSAMSVPAKAIVRLRGIGGLARSSPPSAAPGTGTRLFELAESLAGRSEVVQGPWLRRIDLENPAPDDEDR